MSPHATEDLLRADVRKATEHHKEAREEFWRVAGHLQGDAADTEGVVQSAANAELAAQKALVVALERLNQFLSRSSLPGAFEQESQ